MALATIFDQSTFIEGAISEVLSNAWQGGLLAILVIFFFLKEVRSTAVIALSIPISVVATFVIMYQMGLSLNIMSLGGLALGIGMLVDDSIVVLEVISRHRDMGKTVFQAAVDGTKEVQGAVIASTLTTVAVFLPIVFVEGVGGQLFKDQALTVSFSILASLAISLTLIPMLSAKLGQAPSLEPLAEAAGRVARARRLALYTVPIAVLRGLRAAGRLVTLPVGLVLRPILGVFERLESVVYRAYPRAIAGALRHPWLVLGTAAGLFALSMAAVGRLGVELVPPMVQGEYAFEVRMPEGTPIETVDRLLAELAQRARKVPGVGTVFSTAGGGRGGADQGLAPRTSASCSCSCATATTRQPKPPASPTCAACSSSTRRWPRRSAGRRSSRSRPRSSWSYTVTITRGCGAWPRERRPGCRESPASRI